MKRREFLKNMTLASGAPFLLNGIPVNLMASNSALHLAAATADNDRVLIILQLHGGNDGLNTLIPIDQYSIYYNRRANIAIPDFGARKYLALDSTLPVRDQVGLHPDMVGMKALYDQGKVSIVQGVAYENTNGSHFRGRDIWFMGGNYNDYYSSGWVGRYLDQIYPNYPAAYPNNNMPDPLALEIGNEVSLVFHRSNGIPVSVSVQNPDQFFNLVDELQGFKDKQGFDPRGIPPTSLNNSPYGQELNWILGLEDKSADYATRLKQVFDRGRNSQGISYPTLYPLNAPRGSLFNPLSSQLRLVARLLSGGIKTKIFLVRIGGFDTHAQQVEDYDPTLGRHSALLYHVSSAMKAFQDDLKNLGLENRVLTITLSEFGRRIDSNASYGSDHGTAAPILMFGAGVKPGVIGSNADLSRPGGNLPVQFDYRQIYTAILQDWFGATDDQIRQTLFGNYLNNKLAVINTTGFVTTDLDNFKDARFRLNACYPNPANESTTFSFYLNTPAAVNLGLFDLKGSLVKTVLSNQTFGIGLHEIPVDLSQLVAGTYIYTIETDNLQDSKKLIIQK